MTESLKSIMSHIYELFMGDDYDVQEETVDHKTYLVVYDCSVVPREPVLRVLKETYNKQLTQEIEDKMFDLDEEWR